MTIAFLFFSALILLSSLLVISSRNTIFSTLFLILSFFNVSCLLFLTRLEFLPITLILVYVGAVAILFLFVIMTLNIKQLELDVKDKDIWALILPFFIVFFCEVVFYLDVKTFLNFSTTYYNLFSDSCNFTVFVNDISINFFSTDNIRNLGAFLFINSWFQFILAGFVLLLAMIAVIHLTLFKELKRHNQDVYFQVLRNFGQCTAPYK